MAVLVPGILIVYLNNILSLMLSITRKVNIEMVFDTREGALFYANQICNLVLYYKSNENLLDEYKCLYSKVDDVLRISLEIEHKNPFPESIIDFQEKYINYIPGKECELILSDVFGHSIKIDPSVLNEELNTSTEEGYFQKSTIYNSDELFCIILFENIVRKIPFQFYIDLETINDLIKEKNYAI